MKRDCRNTVRRMGARAHAHGTRGGMTLLELVLAVALLGVVAASVAGLFGFVTSTQLRERQRLAAAEVAHRLVLSYLDDPTALPDPSLPVEYGPPEAPARFRWEYREDRVRLQEVNGDRRDMTRQSPLNPDRFLVVTVRVWLSEESGGARYADGTAPMAVLSRLIDPVAVRNPDSALNTILGNERGRERWIQNMMGLMGGPAQPLAGNGQRGSAQGQSQAQGGARTGPGNRQGMATPLQAFRRGPGGMGGQLVPMSQVGNAMQGRPPGFGIPGAVPGGQGGGGGAR